MYSLLYCTIALSSAWISSGVIVRHYNDVDSKDFQSYTEFSAAFMTNHDSTGLPTTNTNILLGVYEPQCKNQLEIPSFRGAQRQAAGNVLQVGSLLSGEFPLPINGCAEVFYYTRDSSINDPRARIATINHTEITKFVSVEMSTLFRMQNSFPYAVDVYWLEESLDPVLQGSMETGEYSDINTSVGHIFVAKRKGTTDIVDFFVCNGEFYDMNPINRLETCEIEPGTVSNFVKDNTLACDDMDSRLAEYSFTVWHHKRIGLNYVQPKLVPAVTEDGFKLIKLPADTYAWLKTWYNKEQMLLEVLESSSGPCMNQRVSPSSITHLTDTLKKKLSSELQSTLEGWYGGELELTSIYGVRKYTNGSVLRMHVDTVNTHVVSAIINVDQQIDEEWPLLILDHDDNEHEVLMRPGDMVLYESAKLLHGRPTTMVGSHYDNIFIHYRPTEGWDYSWI